MPELPEVETICRQLAPAIERARIVGAEVIDAKWTQPLAPAAFEQALLGRTIERFERRGKYFLARLEDQQTLALHLRMTGNLLLLDEEAAAPDHLRGRLWLESARGRQLGSLGFADPRRFGTAQLFTDATALAEFLDARLGPEPFGPDFDGHLLHAATRRRKTPIKAILLDQRVVAGVGNIYADEALHRAELSPQRRAMRLTHRQADRLCETVREALTAGIDAKGASIDDFRDAYGVQGSFQDQFLVHRREGLPCPRCGATIKKIRCAGRGTYYCPGCQS